MRQDWKAATAGLLALCLAAPLAAKVSPEEAAALGTTLTPVGAEKAGNADGTIPEWTPAAQRGPLSGEYPNDPKIDGEKPIFTIDQSNVDQYRDQLTRGHQYLLDTYDTYKMDVYPSHRNVTWPEEVFAATKVNATSCEMIGVDNPDNCKLGFPFPIPKTGAEPLWNHKLKWRGENATRYHYCPVNTRTNSTGWEERILIFSRKPVAAAFSRTA